MSTVEHESEPATTTEALPPPTVPPARPGVARGGDRIVAGVADGLSDALGVAPMWTRLAFVVLAFFGGLGVAAYVAAWLLMPARPGAPAPRGLRRVAGLAVVPLWLAVIANEGAGQDLFKAPYLIAGLLVGVALALWKPGSTQPRPPVMTTPRTVTPDAVAGPVLDPITAPAPVSPAPAAAGLAPRPGDVRSGARRRRGRHRRDARLQHRGEGLLRGGRRHLCGSDCSSACGSEGLDGSSCRRCCSPA